MDTHGIIQIVIAAIEVVFAIYLFRSRERGHIIYSYCLFIIGVALWVFGNGMYRLVETNSAALFWTNMNHLSAGLIASAFVYFSYVFPYQQAFLKIHHVFAFAVPLAVLAYLLFATNTLIVEITGEMPHRIQVIGSTYSLFAVWFLVYMGWGITNLVHKYRKSSGVYRPLLGRLLVGIVISLVLGSTFDLFFVWFGGPQLFYVGTESSVVWLGMTTYIAFKKP